MELDSLYQQVILDHYKNPKHKNLNESYTAQVHHVNPSCGDEITLNIQVQAGKVAGISWDGVGCSISQASTSIMTELVLGKDIDSAFEILGEFTDLMQSKGTKSGDEEVLEDAVALAGVSKFPARIKCALLGWMAFKDAVLQSKDKLGE
ncbi:MAG: SUF system NifU family Fe-S cluster assembly protein [Actinobacteria bacterium]|jgi:nitrogen fixation NifU-like protein|nr:SUF system NifU family Fe-S cluster assembly protein [Actinomycetota bacterium]